LSGTVSDRPIELVVAAEPYLPSYRASIMAVKLLSDKLGLALRVVGSNWLAARGLGPYLPSFFAGFGGNRYLLLRSEENLNHRELAGILEEDLRRLVGHSRSTTAAKATP
jgi:hypothetical protein